MRNILLKNKRYVFIDIGLWILILLRIYKILLAFQQMKQQIQLPQYYIISAITIVIFWQVNDFYHWSSYSNFARFDDAICTLFVGVLGLILLYILKTYPNSKQNKNLIMYYGIILIIYGMTQGFYACTSYSTFGLWTFLGVVLSFIVWIFGINIISSKYN